MFTNINNSMKKISNIKKSVNKKILRDYFDIKDIRQLRSAWGMQNAKPLEIYELMALQYNEVVEQKQKQLIKDKAKAKHAEKQQIYLYKLYYDAYKILTKKKIVGQKTTTTQYLKYDGKKIFSFQSKKELKLTPFVYLNVAENEKYLWSDYQHKGHYANYPVADTLGQLLNYFPDYDIIYDALSKIGDSKNVGVFYNIHKEKLHKKDSKLKNMKLFYAYVNCPNPSFRGFEDLGDMQCVPNILYKHLTQKNLNKKLTIDKIIDMLESNYCNDLDYGLDNVIKGKRGYTSEDIVKVLDEYKCPYKLLNIKEEIFLFDTKKGNYDKNLYTFVGQVYNNHLYYCNDRDYIKSMASIQNAKNSNSNYVHAKKEEEEDENTVFDGDVLQQSDLTSDYIEQFKLDRTVRKVKLFDDQIVSIKYDDRTVYANKDKEIVEIATKNLSLPFKNQNLTTIGIILFKKFQPTHQKSCFNVSVFNTLNVNAGIVEYFNEYQGGSLTQIDINKCRTNCAINNIMGKYPIFDINNEWEEFNGNLNQIGYFYAESKNNLPMRGNNIYSGEFLTMCKNDGIEFKVTHQLIAEESYDEDYLKEFVEGVMKAAPDHYKKMTNSCIGYFGRTISKSKTGYIETDYNEAVANFWENPNIGSVYNLQDRIQSERIRGKDITKDGYNMVDVGTIEIDENTNHYLVQKTHAEKLFENDLPLYNKILENEYWNIYQLYKKAGGNLLKIKTDCVILENQENDIEFDDKIGGYKEERIDGFYYGNSTEPKINEIKTFETVLNWNEVCKVEWDDTDNFFESLIKKIPDTSMLIQGLAGSGKSEIVKHMDCFKDAIVLAFTNKATEGLLGKTICKYFGIDFETGKYCRKKLKALKDTKHIIVDECFMCPPFCIKVFDVIRKMHPHIVWIFIGDPEQTRPVGKEHINWLDTKVFYDLCSGNRLSLIRNMRNPKATKKYLQIIDGGTPNDYSKFSESEINITRTNKKRMEINTYYMDKNCGIDSHFIPNILEDESGNEISFHEKAQDVFLNLDTPVMAIITSEDLGLVNSGIYNIQSLNPIMINDVGYTDYDFMNTFVVCYAMTNHKVQSITIKTNFIIHEWLKMTPRERYTAYSRGTHKQNVKIIN